MSGRETSSPLRKKMVHRGGEVLWHGGVSLPYFALSCIKERCFSVSAHTMCCLLLPPYCFFSLQWTRRRKVYHCICYELSNNLLVSAVLTEFPFHQYGNFSTSLKWTNSWDISRLFYCKIFFPWSCFFCINWKWFRHVLSGKIFFFASLRHAISAVNQARTQNAHTRAKTASILFYESVIKIK